MGGLKKNENKKTQNTSRNKDVNDFESLKIVLV